MEIRQLLDEFWLYVKNNDIEIYNEFSFQHELGIYLRGKISNYKVQFERNIKYFYDYTNTLKKEIDIVVFNDIEKYAIELKYPKNGQYPEQMFSFIKDIRFMEELKELGFSKTYVMTLVDDHNFYEGNASGVYSYFRDSKLLTGNICKPTGKKDEIICLKGSYHILWNDLFNDSKYYLIEI